MSYLLAYKHDDAKPERTLQTFADSREHHLAFQKDIDHPAFDAVCEFLRTWQPERLQAVAKLEQVRLHDEELRTKLEVEGQPQQDLTDWEQQQETNHDRLTELRETCGDDLERLAGISQITTGFGVFQIRDQLHYVHQQPDIDSWWQHRLTSKTQAATGTTCLVTGRSDKPIADLHAPKIKNVKAAQGAGALIVSFNKKAYESFGKESGDNAPVSTEATAKYCKALNALLTSDKHRLQIGDATTVFWTEKPTRTESALHILFDGSPPDDSDDKSSESSQATNLAQSLRSTLRALGKGGKPDPEIANESQVPFYILGLTGQAGGRIGIRFWHRTSVGDLLEKLARHHADLAIVPQWGEDSKYPDPKFPTFRDLLSETAREEKVIPPNLGGALMRALLNGSAYPAMLAERVLARIRIAEKDRNGKPKDRVNYLRASILKVFLTRNHKLKMEEALDTTRTEPAYHFGRLFAVYETAQRHAHDWKLERTIRETLYSSASATPLAVFGRLERLHHHHTAKKTHPQGSSNSYADIVSEIAQNFRTAPPYPASLGLIDQSLFAVGYYHQLHYFKSLADEAKKKRTQTH